MKNGDNKLILNGGENLESETKYNSYWYNRFQGALFLLAFLTFGIGDGLSSLWMVGQQGIMKESNPILMHILLKYGESIYLEIKIWYAIIILFMIYWLQIDSKKPVYWTVNGCLIAFIVSGTLSILLNIRAGRNEPLFFSAEQTIFLFMFLVLMLTSIGEEIDKWRNPRIKSYAGCLLNDLMIIYIFISKMFKKKTGKSLFWPTQKG
jgi:hypothetical protein